MEDQTGGKSRQRGDGSSIVNVQEVLDLANEGYPGDLKRYYEVAGPKNQVYEKEYRSDLVAAALVHTIVSSFVASEEDKVKQLDGVLTALESLKDDFSSAMKPIYREYEEAQGGDKEEVEEVPKD